MTDQRLRTIEVEGFTSIGSASVPLGRLNVLVGANGAGKSNFIHALELLGRIVDNQLNYFVGKNGGASALLNAAGGATRISLRLTGAVNGYEADLEPAAGDELIFTKEIVKFQADGFDRPYNDVLGRGHRETRLHGTAAESQNRSIASYVVDLLRGCRVFHFHDTSVDAPVKQLVSTADSLGLRDDAGNLAAVLLRLADEEPGAYRRVLSAIRRVAPFFDDFVLRPDARERILLRWRQHDSDAVFSANQLSDGTLRFICLATLLLQPELPALVVLDEPELGLHPSAIMQLADLLRQAARRSQVLIATQSVTLMNQFELDDLIVVDRAEGESTFSRPDPERLKHHSLGELWEKNLIR